MIRSRRFAFIAAATIVGLTGAAAVAGCGDVEQSSWGAPQLIHVGGGSGAMAGAATAGESADKAMIAPWYQNVEYVWTGDASGLAGGGKAWSLPVGAQPDASRVRRIADTFGVQGDLRAVPGDQGGGWHIGTDGYEEPGIWVGADGMLSWWYNAGGAVYEGWACAEPAVAVDPATGGSSDASSGSDGSTTPVPPADTVPTDTSVTPPDGGCVEPTPPAGVPSQAEAEAMARDMFQQMGYDLDEFVVETWADDWGASVNAFLTLEGHRTPLILSVGFGGEGAVTWASGYLAEPQQLSDYPTVGVDEVVARLNDRTGKWGWFGGWYAYGARGGVAVDTVMVDPAGQVGAAGQVGSATAVAAPVPTVIIPVPETVVPGSDVPAETVVVPPVDTGVVPPDTIPVDTVPIETITVELTAVSADLTMVWDTDGTMYLLPAYTFTTSDGGTVTMVAVDEQYLDMPTANEVPMPLEPGTPTDVVAPTVESATEALVGLGIDEATKVAEGNGWTVRVSTLDGEDQMLTEDYSVTRVDVVVEAGTVTAVDFIG